MGTKISGTGDVVAKVNPGAPYCLNQGGLSLVLPDLVQMEVAGDGEQVGFQGFSAGGLEIDPGADEGFGSDILRLGRIPGQPVGKPVHFR